MTRDRLYLYDTTLRDGQQTQGVQFSATEKHQIAAMLDSLGVDHIEGGWPGANPTDAAFFADPPTTSAAFTAFGMTKRAGRSAANDDVLAAVLNAGTASVCLVGKTHDYHVETALGITLDENLENIRASVAHCVAEGRETLFDAEHFFDGYRANPTYALACLRAAFEPGARWIVLCDTNGGTLPDEIARTVTEVIAAGLPGDRLGIHTHDDTGTAVAGSLAAIDAGVRQIQGTLNGLGERCGNANLVSLIPTLLLKPAYADRFETGVAPGALAGLTRVSRQLDDILNRVPQRSAPYVGASAFAHKAGLHASAIGKDPSTYEHVAPDVVGNARIVPMSNQAGQSNLISRLHSMGIAAEKGDPALARILEAVKAREAEGYSYDTAQASFELLARDELGQLPQFFEVLRYRVTVEKRREGPRRLTLSEAVVVVRIGAGQGAVGVGIARRDRLRPWPGERAGQGAGQGSRAVSGVHRRPPARRLQGADHPGRHRGGDPRGDRQRGWRGPSLGHGGGQPEHRRRLVRGAVGRDRLEADPRRRDPGVTVGPVGIAYELRKGPV